MKFTKSQHGKYRTKTESMYYIVDRLECCIQFLII